MNSSWAISNPKRWCCESAALNTPANLENLSVATGLEKVRFHSNLKERQCQRMFKLPYNCAHLPKNVKTTIQLCSFHMLERLLSKSFKLGFSSTWTEHCLDVQAGFRRGRGTKDQIANIRWIIEKATEFQKNIYFCFIDCTNAFDCVDHKKLWKILQEMGIPDHLTCLLWNLYADQEATVRLVPNCKRSTSRLYIVTLLI